MFTLISEHGTQINLTAFEVLRLTESASAQRTYREREQIIAVLHDTYGIAWIVCPRGIGQTQLDNAGIRAQA